LPDKTGHLLTELRDMLFRELELRDHAHAETHAASAEALTVAFASHSKQHGDLDQARQLAHESLLHRLESMNLFREQLSAQATTFVQQSELNILRSVNDALLERIQATIRELELTKPSRDETAQTHKTMDARSASQQEMIRQLELSVGNLQARLYTVTGFLGVAMAAASILLAVFR